MFLRDGLDYEFISWNRFNFGKNKASRCIRKAEDSNHAQLYCSTLLLNGEQNLRSYREGFRFSGSEKKEIQDSRTE